MARSRSNIEYRYAGAEPAPRSGHGRISVLLWLGGALLALTLSMAHGSSPEAATRLASTLHDVSSSGPGAVQPSLREEVVAPHGLPAAPLCIPPALPIDTSGANGSFSASGFGSTPLAWASALALLVALPASGRARLRPGTTAVLRSASVVSRVKQPG